MSNPLEPLDQPQPLVQHLIELRNRLLKCTAVVLIIFIPLAVGFSREIYTLFARPLMDAMPIGTTMIATDVTSTFLVPFKLTFYVSLLLAMPFILHQVWSFVSPGLYRHEKKFAVPLLASSVLLFYLGIAFAYFVVFPVLFAFFTAITPDGVAMMTDISRYLDFVITLFIAFGVSFEVPVAIVLLVLTGISSSQSLAEKRPYVIVGCFIIGMLLTPPDVISQTLLAAPMWMLFELGLIAARYVEKDRAQTAAEKTAE